MDFCLFAFKVGDYFFGVLVADKDCAGHDENCSDFVYEAWNACAVFSVIRGGC